ncbi:MAG: inositol monophosphatase family protein [Carnobacterium sp.]|uniref:inositol monophosphatase family protein n=1 Tax=Carnobacterium sp. TaxID=48221 RepID=UPI002FC92A82
MKENEFYEIHFFAEHLIKDAGEIIKKKWNESFETNTKKHEQDFVTSLDIEVEAFLVRKIKAKYPTHSINSEEGFGDENINNDGIVWGIDPIDGTANLVYMRKDFAISIGVYQAGVGQLAYIYDVMQEKLYSAKKGAGAFENGIKLNERVDRKMENALIYTRYSYIYQNTYQIRDLINEFRGLGHMSCASLGFVELAKGNIDVMLGKGNMKFWDIAAGKLFAEENGVVFQGIDGEPYEFGVEKDMLAAGPQLSRVVLKGLNRHEVD